MRFSIRGLDRDNQLVGLLVAVNSLVNIEAICAEEVNLVDVDGVGGAIRQSLESDRDNDVVTAVALFDTLKEELSNGLSASSVVSLNDVQDLSVRDLDNANLRPLHVSTGSGLAPPWVVGEVQMGAKLVKGSD